MEAQTLEQPPQTALRQSRPQSEDVNAISRNSRVGGSRNSFLLITSCLAFSSWIISLVSQAIVAATISHGNAGVRLLWFGIVIQFILLVEIFEVVVSRNTIAYGAQISIFAGLATVFAVIGVDQNIYASLPAQKAIGAGWLITAIIDLLWIIYFTSPPDSHFTRLAGTLASSRSFSRHAYRPNPVEKVEKSQDAFIMSPPNGSTDARPGTEALKKLSLGKDGFDTLAAVDIDDRLKGETMRVPERTSGYVLDEPEPRRGSKTRSGGLWSNYTPSSQHGGPRATMSSGGMDEAGGVEREASALISEREASARPESEATSVTSPDAPSQSPTHSKARTSRMPTYSVGPAQSAKEPIQWRAEALFDYMGATDDPNELSFKKGDHLVIIDKSGKWWEARTKDGRKGIAPSNYLRLLI